MALNTLNTRIAMRYDTYAHWSAASANPVLLKGEIAVVEVPVSTSEVAQEPAILFKIGDGVSHFNDLPYLSAIAADVYDWAKKTTPDASDFPWLTSFIQGAIKDTNTTYTFARGKDAEGKDNNTLVVTPSEGNPVTISLAPTGYVTTAQFSPVSASVAAHDTKLNTIDSQLSEMNAEINTHLNEAEVDARIEAKKAEWGLDGEYADKTDYEAKVAALEAKDTALQNAVAKLNNGSTVEGSVDYKISKAVDNLLKVGNDTAAIDTVKEVIDYIAEHDPEYASLLASVKVLEDKVGLEENETVSGIVEDAVSGINEDLYGAGGSSGDVKGGIVKDIETLQSDVDTADSEIDALQTLTGSHTTQITGLLAEDAAINSRIDAYSMDDIKQGDAGYFVLSCGAAAYYNAAEKAAMESGASAANLPS